MANHVSHQSNESVCYKGGDFVILISSADGEYLFYTDKIILNGTYSAGDSECIPVYIDVYDDNLVEGTEEVFDTDDDNFSGINIQTYIIDNDCKSLQTALCVCVCLVL